MNKQNNFTIITSIVIGLITLAIILWAIIPNAPFKNEVKDFFRGTTSNIPYVPEKTTSGDDSTGSKTQSDLNVDTEGYKIPEMDSYDLDLTVGNIHVTKVKNGHTPHISIARYTNHADNIRVSITNSKIKVTNEGFDSIDPNNYRIDIYLPEKKLNSLSLKVGAGSIEVTELSSDTFSSKLAAGNVLIKDCNFSNIDNSIFAGNYTLYLSDSVQAVSNNVLAGQLKMYVPDNIQGFTFNYSLAAGNLNINNSFSNSDSGFKIGRTGTFTYKNGFARLSLSMTAGNVEVNKYSL